MGRKGKVSAKSVQGLAAALEATVKADRGVKLRKFGLQLLVDQQ
jgi:hypothetical protein